MSDKLRDCKAIMSSAFCVLRLNANASSYDSNTIASQNDAGKI